MGLFINIDRGSREPLFRQIVDQVVRLTRSGALQPGDRLPASRTLARQMGVNRSTVYKAYEELWSSGYLESRPGSYSVVRERVQPASQKQKPEEGLIPWAERSQPGVEEVLRAAIEEKNLIGGEQDPGLINFVPLSPDSRLFPVDEFRRSMSRVLARRGLELLQYGEPLGYAPLRKLIARRMNLHSVSVTPEEIMITTGAQGGLALVLRLLMEPGDGVVLESPTYSRALDVLRLSRARLLEVPLNRRGMDLEALENLLSRESPALIYTIPNFHNPSGVTTDQPHREKLLKICEKHRVPLVEDGFEEEMKYFGKAVPPIKSMDRFGVVIYLGTFSKVLFPGLRIAWIAAHADCIKRLEPIQRSLILSSNQVDQAALENFCAQGHYELHLKRMHRIYRKRMGNALAALQTHLDPALAQWTEPAGRYTIWVRLKREDINETQLTTHLKNHGVLVLPGSSHYIGPPKDIHFRLSIAHLDEPAIEEGIRRLGRGLRDLYVGEPFEKGSPNPS